MARKGPLPRLLLINAPRVATDFKPLSPSSGEEVVSRVRQALSRLMTSAARQSALVAAANPNLATRAQASLSRTFPTSGLATVHKTIGGRLSDGPDKWPSYASSAGELCIEWSFSELSKTLASAALSAVTARRGRRFRLGPGLHSSSCNRTTIPIARTPYSCPHVPDRRSSRP